MTALPRDPPPRPSRRRAARSPIVRALSERAREAAVAIAQAWLDDPARVEARLCAAGGRSDSGDDTLAWDLWREALILVCRALFLLQLEASGDAARAAYFLELPIPPNLREILLWMPEDKQPARGGLRGPARRARVPYESLDVEDLGSVYESLVDREPGIATEPMCRLRRAGLEVVVPVARGAPHRAAAARPGRRGSTVVFIEEIPPGRFYLQTGLGRKASGSYYTPRPFVRYLVREALAPQIAERSPEGDPNPGAVLGLRALDPSMGTGHFLIEACRYLGDAFDEACRRCYEMELAAEEQARGALSGEARGDKGERDRALRARLGALPVQHIHQIVDVYRRVYEGDGGSLARREARALARQLVAARCLYGVDIDPIAVEVARLALWVESSAGGSPFTFLRRRLVCGDSLAGPSFEQMLTAPATGAPVGAAALRADVARALQRATEPLRHADAVVDADAEDALDEALRPLRLAAAAWSGAVRLGSLASEDAAYERLLRAVSDGEQLDRAALERGGVARWIRAGSDAAPFELLFPEAFHSAGGARHAGGFDAVVGNPPWEAITPHASEFYAALDLRVLDAPTKRERSAIERRLSADARVAAAFDRYVGSFASTKRSVRRLFSSVNRAASGAALSASLDRFQPFAERSLLLLRPGGRLALLLPGAFHANAGAAGLRELFLNRARLSACFSFTNRRALFPIHRSFKFALVVAARDERGSTAFNCAFYLDDIAWLEGPRACLTYTRAFLEATGGPASSFIELTSQADVAVVERGFASGELFGSAATRAGVRFGRELHMTDDAARLTPARRVDLRDSRSPEVALALRERGYLPLHEGKTFHHYRDQWADPPRYLVALSAALDKPRWTRAARYFRIALRDIARSTDERTAIACLLPAGVLCGNKAPCERAPEARPSARALALLGVINSFSFDFLLRTKVQATVNLFMLSGCPAPALDALRERAIVHLALRLSCNHDGFAPLWAEQLGGAWRESRPRGASGAFSVFYGEREADARWGARSAIDALVADAYGLSREAYAHVLASFRGVSYPSGPQRCLSAFDELQAIGLEAFVKRHDPYWDIPLVMALPRPAVELQGVE